MRDAFAEVLGEDLVGAALAVDLDGELVVDLWGGRCDAAGDLPWERDTLVHAYSVSKPFAAIALLLLVDRGLVGLDEPVAAYWPEFGAGGKAGIPVRWLCSRTRRDWRSCRSRNRRRFFSTGSASAPPSPPPGRAGSRAHATGSMP